MFDTRAIKAARARVVKAQEKLAALTAQRKEFPRDCRGCGKGIPQGSRGRPREWCDECRGGEKWREVRRAIALRSYHATQEAWRRRERYRADAEGDAGEV